MLARETSQRAAAFGSGRDGGGGHWRGAGNPRWNGAIATAYGAKAFVGSDAMSKDCEKWKDQLLKAALQGEVAKDLQEHLQSCGDCAAEFQNLEARRAQMDALLPLVARGAQPSAGF